MTDIIERLRAEDPECGLRHSIATEAADFLEKQKEYINYYQDQTNALLKKIERLEGNIRTGIYMRQRQKQYLKDKTQKNLVEAKQAEAAFDRVTEKYI